MDPVKGPGRIEMDPVRQLTNPDGPSGLLFASVRKKGSLLLMKETVVVPGETEVSCPFK